MAELYVDTHCHLDRFSDPEAVLGAAAQRRVVVVSVTETASDFQSQLLQLGDQRFLRLALGLHPLRAAHLSGREIERFFSSLGRTDYVGEVGIDLSRYGKATGSRQIEIFERILSTPQVKTKVLTVHSRGAAAETVDRLEQAGIVGILHWYTGSLSVAERALSAGLYFSVNPAMLRSKRGRKLIASLPRGRVLTETDGPYCRLGSRPCQPIDIPSVIHGLATLWGIAEDQAASRVAENMADLHSRVVEGSEAQRSE